MKPNDLLPDPLLPTRTSEAAGEKARASLGVTELDEDVECDVSCILELDSVVAERLFYLTLISVLHTFAPVLAEPQLILLLPV